MEEEKFTAYSRKLFSLGFGSLCLLLSLIFQSRAGFIRLAVHDHFSVAIVFILSVLNAWGLFRYVSAYSYREQSPLESVLDFLTYLLFSAGLFNVVMFPASGLGIAEMVILMIFMLGNFSMSHINTDRIKFAGMGPWSTAIFGLILWTVKLVTFYFFEDSIYSQMVSGNSIVRGIIFAFAIIGAFVLFRHVSKIGEAHVGIKTQKKKIDAKNVFIAIGKTVASAVKNFCTFVFSIFTGWVGIIVILIAGLLILGIGIFAFQSFFDAVMKPVEIILQKLMTTGEYSVNPSMAYTVCQISAMLIYIVFSFLLTASCSKSLDAKCGRLLENKVLNHDEFKSLNRVELKRIAEKKIRDERNEIKRIAIASDEDLMKDVVTEIADDIKEKD